MDFGGREYIGYFFDDIVINGIHFVIIGTKHQIDCLPHYFLNRIGVCTSQFRISSQNCHRVTGDIQFGNDFNVSVGCVFDEVFQLFLCIETIVGPVGAGFRIAECPDLC